MRGGRFEAVRSSPLYQRVLLALLFLLAAISTVEGAKNAIQHSQDLQWSGSKMLLAHIDPWAEYLRGDPNHLILPNQYPNYLPILYLLIFPLGLLPLLPAKILWLACNLTFAIASAILAARFYNLHGRTILAVVCLMLMATPTRNTIGNGQQGLLVLFIWCLTLIPQPLTDQRSAITGLSYGKFNFAPPVVLYLFFRGGLRSVLLSALPSVLATALIWLWLGGPYISIAHLIAEPVLVSRTGYFPSALGSNWMDVLELPLALLHTPESLVKIIALGSALLLCTLVLYFAIKRHPGSSIQWQLALLATLSFGLFKHHPYDAVVLLFPFCYALHLHRAARAKAVLLLISFIWYAQRILDAATGNHVRIYVLHFAVLMVVLVMTYQLKAFEQQTEPTWATAKPLP